MAEPARDTAIRAAALVKTYLQPDEIVIIHPGASVHEGARVASR